MLILFLYTLYTLFLSLSLDCLSKLRNDLKSIADNTITDLLQEYDIHAGDVFFLPAGRVHSIGAGAFIAEIQQTSNITYRIYDFNRCDDSGKPRELHTELSKAAIDYTVLPDYRTYYEAKEDAEVQLAACRYFTTSLCKLTKEYRMDIADLDSFVILICTKGNGTVTDDCGNSISIKQGESILVPATAKTLDIVPACDMELLSCVTFRILTGTPNLVQTLSEISARNLF